MKKKPFMSIKDYAAKNSMSVQSVYQAIKRGKLKGRKIAGFQFVEVD